ncbi:hypothetical protein Sjap_004920 [Stephania japonica]|uniref:Carbohydrate kinase PfkB domain-containing protein n=1 Tax=Stephania japonica TaxID=461633 RepID=A0AAP0K347_9MAGN
MPTSTSRSTASRAPTRPSWQIQARPSPAERAPTRPCVQGGWNTRRCTSGAGRGGCQWEVDWRGMGGGRGEGGVLEGWGWCPHWACCGDASSDGHNSIIIVGGLIWRGGGRCWRRGSWRLSGMLWDCFVLEEIPDYVNIQVAKGVNEVLVKLGSKGSALFDKSGSSLQPLHKLKSTPSTPPPPPFASFPSLRDGAITEEEKRSPSLLLCESEALARKVAVLSDSIKLQPINWRYHLPTIRKSPIEIRETVHIKPKRERIEIRIHGECRFYFGDHVLPCFETGIPLLKRRLHQLPDAENKVVFKTRGDLGNALAEVEEVVNIATALGENTLSLFFKAARSAGVPVILDAGGMDGLIPVDLLTNVDIFSPNETELERLTGMPTKSFEQISQSVAKIHEMVSFRTILFYFGDHVLPCFETGIPLLKRRLHQLPDAENKVVFKTRGDLDNALAEAEEEVIIQVHEALRGSVVDGQIVDDKDLTTKRLRELKLVLQGLQSEKAARSAGVPVILDAGGMDGLIPVDLLTNVDIFSPNETELGHLTRMATESFEQICQSVVKIHEMYLKENQLKLLTLNYNIQKTMLDIRNIHKTLTTSITCVKETINLCSH